MPDDAEKHRAEVVQSYLAAPKVVAVSIAWRDKNHPDFVEAKLPVTCSEMPEINGEVRLTAHKTRVPLKYSFALLVGSVRVAALDVSPGQTHFNTSTLTSISGTHWQWFPAMEAEPDGRDLTHREWLAEFGKRTKIDFNGPYRAPPHAPVQLVLL